MGRKTTKGAKERKMRRKEEQVKLAAAKIKVDAANKLEDPMVALVPFKKFDRNGVSLKIDCQRLPQLDGDTQTFIFDLCKDNMQALYESSNWGWKDREKKEEMLDDRAWYLIARDTENKPVAFVHFRFDIEIDEEVLYCYEIQLTKDVRRKGLGKFLMQILELIAFKAEMLKVMLTTFKHNDSALKFFMEALKYQIDESSPEDGMYEEDCQYWILSKPIKSKTPKPSPTPQGACCGGHAHAHGHTNGHSHGMAS